MARNCGSARPFRSPEPAGRKKGPLSRPLRPTVPGKRASDFHHLEIVLGDAAVRAGPGVRDVFPARTRGNAFFRQALGLVVDESAYDAHPGAVNGSRGGFSHG